MVRPIALAVLSFAGFQFGVFPAFCRPDSASRARGIGILYHSRRSGTPQARLLSGKPHDIMTTKTIDQPARRLRPLLRWAERLLTLVRDALPSPGYIYVETFCSLLARPVADINLDLKKDLGNFAQVLILSTRGSTGQLQQGMNV